jgi:hypothetical protein
METPKPKTTDNAVKLIGEAFLPGASLLLDGRILAGGAHAIVGTLARFSLGPIGAVLVAANSFSESVTGKNLLKHLKQPAGSSEAKPPSKPAAS